MPKTDRSQRLHIGLASMALGNHAERGKTPIEPSKSPGLCLFLFNGRPLRQCRAEQYIRMGRVAQKLPSSPHEVLGCRGSTDHVIYSTRYLLRQRACFSRLPRPRHVVCSATTCGGLGRHMSRAWLPRLGQFGNHYTTPLSAPYSSLYRCWLHVSRKLTISPPPDANMLG